MTRDAERAYVARWVETGRMLRRFALERRVLLLETASGVPLDISLGGLPYEARVIERSTPWEVEPGVTVMTCSAEDLLVLKAFAGRVQDWTSSTSCAGWRRRNEFRS